MLDISSNVFRLENKDFFGTEVYILGHKQLDDQPESYYPFYLKRLCAEYGLQWFNL